MKLILSILLLCGAAFGSAANIYITQSGSTSGNCTTGVHNVAYFNNVVNWGAGSTKIGSDTVVLFCGTFADSSQGTALLTTQGAGTSGHPVILKFDTGAAFNSTGWWGSYTGTGVGTGAINIANNFITLDGGTNGIIQNLLAGCVQGATNFGSGTAVCGAGVSAKCNLGLSTCTQAIGAASGQGSQAVSATGDHIVIKNLTIRTIYANTGFDVNATDKNGSLTNGINVSGTNIEVAYNDISGVSVGVNFTNPGGSGANSNPNSCPAAGICIHDNSIHDTQKSILSGTTATYAGSGITNVYRNNLTDWLKWQTPSATYHLSGVNAVSGNAHSITDYIFNNYAYGAQGASGTGAVSNGYVYCASDQLIDSAGTSCYVYNNLFYSADTANIAGQVGIGQPDRCGVSAWSITTNVLTLTLASSGANQKCSNGVTPWAWPTSESLILTGFAGESGSFLDNQTISISTINSTTITAAFTHANASGSGTTAYGYDAGNMGPYYLYNNTFLYGSKTGGSVVNFTYSGNPAYYTLTQKNNIFLAYPTSTPGTFFEDSTNGLSGWTTLTSETNLYYNDRGSLFTQSTSGWWGTAVGSPNDASHNFTAWKTACSCDSTSTYTNPLVRLDGTLQSNSPAIQGGTNLTSVGLASLNADKNGEPRQGGAWTLGAITVGVGPATNLFVMLNEPQGVSGQ